MFMSKRTRSKFGIKFLTETGWSVFSRSKWPPVRKWTEIVPYPHLCRRGWHLAAPNDYGMRWGSGSHVAFLAEGKGEYQESEDKIAFSQARLIKKIGRTPSSPYVDVIQKQAEALLRAFRAARKSEIERRRRARGSAPRSVRPRSSDRRTRLGRKVRR